LRLLDLTARQAIQTEAEALHRSRTI
jgi:hypothetical protein